LADNYPTYPFNAVVAVHAAKPDRLAIVLADDLPGNQEFFLGAGEVGSDNRGDDDRQLGERVV
jgi:hypothetical protein